MDKKHILRGECDMRKVVEHGKFYQEKKKMVGIPYVECPECGCKIDVDLDCVDYSDSLAHCECECEFSFEEEDVKYKKLRKKHFMR